MYVYIYICVCVYIDLCIVPRTSQNHLGGICVCETGLGSLGSSDPRLRGSKDLAHRKAPGKPHISHGRVADFIEIDAEGLTVTGPVSSIIIYHHLSSLSSCIFNHGIPWVI
jgi:hypothetical protein